ncbi:MAG: hypothetical protein DRN60_03465 [Thaumarchaeota archaeon]|nr:MAG: hypothetical protein DRN60_03465 [Nitrososphaerota archaeon]
MLEVLRMFYAPWICWISPFIGSILSLFIGGEKDVKLKGTIASIFTGISWIMALLMLPEIFKPGLRDIWVGWITLPYGEPVKAGVLLDPLSIILANIVSFISLLVLIYSIKYMEGEYGQARYWSLISLFVGGMLLLVLADNFILFFIGWKIVGFCSYALIGHYYRDERRYWIGGPPPHPFEKPSTCGLKALIVTTFGDVAMLAGILIIYLYAGTFNFLTLFSTTNIWMAKMAANPGIITLTTILLLGGPIAKSAQFPLHVWLPEAMAGPAPVSALIHAATMVKAGVYIVARLFPIFFNGYWVNRLSEAFNFFPIIAVLGTLTAFITATDAMVSLELKKILAYSTMSQIGYMMVALGAAGMSINATITGYVGGLYHLLSHALFKAALFLCAGLVIHVTGSIYIHEKGLSRKYLPMTWVFMWFSALSLAGVPPFSGFWSKDEILIACINAGQYGLFLAALLTAGITCFYSIRMMGYIFYSRSGEVEEVHGEPKLMWIPFGVLSSLTLIIGLMGYWLGEVLHDIFSKYFTHVLRIPLTASAHTSTSLTQLIVPLSSIIMLLIAGIPAYTFYISQKADSWKIVGGNAALRLLHKILWNRWYIDKFYRMTFVRGLHLSRPIVQRYVEDLIDSSFNIGVPKLFAAMYGGLRRVQTGVASINILYILIFLTSMVIVILAVI